LLLVFANGELIMLLKELPNGIHVKGVGYSTNNKMKLWKI